MTAPNTAVDLAAEREGRNRRLDEKAGREPREVVPLREEPERRGVERPDLAENRHQGAHKLTTAQQDELRAKIEDLLREDPEVAGVDAYRALVPDEAITYATFMASYFGRVKRRLKGRPAESKRHEPRPRSPSPKATEANDAPPLRLPFSLGSIEGRPLGDGDLDVTVRLPRLSERNLWTLIDLLRPMLTEGAGRAR